MKGYSAVEPISKGMEARFVPGSQDKIRRSNSFYSGGFELTLRREHIQHLPRFGADAEVGIGYGEQDRSILAYDVSRRQW
jgi:hypothetical protein